MKTARYVCTHCGKRFEAEEKEIVECPGCFWSTSVKKEDDAEVSKPLASAAANTPTAKTKSRSSGPAVPFNFDFKPLLKILGILAVIAIFLWGAWLILPKLGKLFQSRPNKKAGAPIGIKIGGAEDKAGKPGQNTGGAAGLVAGGAGGSGAAGIPANLTPEEKNILDRAVQISADREPSADEQKILSNHASFQTGIVEKLPSQAWNLTDFKNRLAQQEKLYKVSLPGSYKAKLNDLFKKKYLAAAEAFKNGDLVGARNLWVESLAFPLYSQNVAKHRGVALTLLRPFIDDTLSKIGAINGSLVEQKVREKETSVTTAYEKMLAAIKQKNWAEAASLAATVTKSLEEFSNPTQLAGQPGAYPPGIAQVDEGIRGTLMGMLNIPPPAISDLEPVRVDVAMKQRVLDSFNPQLLDQQQMAYREAKDLITQGRYSEAAVKLRQIHFPVELVQDAQEKLKILQKFQQAPPPVPQPALDSRNKSR